MAKDGQRDLGWGALVSAVVALVAGLLGLGAVLAWELPGDTRSPFVRKLDEMADELEPDIVVLGNSTAGRAVDPDVLRDSVDASVANMAVGGTQLPVWYAVLENRVYARGHRPRVVLVAAALRDMLALGRVTRGADGLLRENMGPSEPVIQAKVFKAEPSPLQDQLRERQRWMRREVVFGLPGSLLALTDGSAPHQGRARVQSAINGVFDDSEVDFELVGKERLEKALAGASPAVPVLEGMVPDLIDLAHENDSEIVFLRTPVAPGNPYVDPVTVEQERELIALLNERGAGYASLWEVPLRASDFQDPVHLAESGRAKITRRIGELLRSWSKHGPLRIPPAALPFPVPAVTRTGTVPEAIALPTEPGDADCPLAATLPQLGPFGARQLSAVGLERAAPVVVLQDGEPLHARAPGPCAEGTFYVDGPQLRLRPRPSWSDPELELAAIADVERPDVGMPAHWLFPGTSIEYSWEEPWPVSRGPLEVVAAVQPVGPGRGTPELSVGAARAELTGRGGQLRASLVAPNPVGPWSVRISNPPDGPHAAIVAVTLGRRAHRTWVERVRFRPLDGGVVLVGRPDVAATWASDPPPLPPPLRSPQLRPKGKVGMFRVPELAHLADNITGRCSPVVVLEDGLPLPRRHEICRAVERRRGAMCHGRNTVAFTSTDGSPPGENGREYTLALDRTPGSHCSTELWLFPGDRLEVTLDAQALPMLHGVARAIELSGLVVSGESELRGQLGVRLDVDGTTRARAKVPVGSISDGVGTLPLDPPVAPTAWEGKLVLSNPRGGPFVLVRSAVLLE